MGECVSEMIQNCVTSLMENPLALFFLLQHFLPCHIPQSRIYGPDVDWDRFHRLSRFVEHRCIPEKKDDLMTSLLSPKQGSQTRGLKPDEAHKSTYVTFKISNAMNR